MAFSSERQKLSTLSGNEGVDSVALYLNQIGQYPLLNARQEIELGTKVQQGILAAENLQAAEATKSLVSPQLYETWTSEVQLGQVAKNDMITANLRLVVSIAKKYRNEGLQLLDVIQDGNIGLAHAVDKFDPTKGFKFSTYATWWIRQSISVGIQSNSSTVRLPSGPYVNVKALTKAQDLLRNEGKRERDPVELSRVLGMTVLEVHKLLETVQLVRPLSLDSSSHDEYEMSHYDRIAAPDDTEELAINQVASMRTINRARAVVSEREWVVLSRRYLDSMSLEEVGKELGVSRERIRQIEYNALKKLRAEPRLRG